MLNAELIAAAVADPKFHPRFWRRIDKAAPNGCWIWLKRHDRKGYGQAMYRQRNLQAHRVAWWFIRGPIPHGLCVLHNCPGGDNSACVNPDHLWLGTVLDNNADMVRKQRHHRGEEQHLAKLTASLVIEIRRRVAAGEVQRRIAEELGVSYATICRVKTRRCWDHVA